MTISITIKHGISGSITKDFEAPVTVRQVLTPEVKSILGAGDNVTVKINGVAVSLDHMINQNGITLRLETAAASKASA